MSQTKASAEAASPEALAAMEDEVAYLAKRHRVSPAIVREIMKRAAVEREIKKGKARR
jgi:hypothetical protein